MAWLERIRGLGNRPVAPAIEPVRFPALPLSYPADVFRIPVLVISYFPATDGQIRRSVTGDVEAPLETLREHTRRTTQLVAQALDLGSVYHGYGDTSAQPSLRYEIVDSIERLEPLPTWSKPGHAVPMTDYHAILEHAGVRRWVEERGVREIWIWGYHGGVLDLWESNMAGPYGDISNSDRDPNDLPVFDRTYTVYHYNYARGPSEAVEDHIHQIEALFRHVDSDLFWKRFVGRPGEGRCGWAHYPPNGRHDYDWANQHPIATDIEDWRPEGGERQVLDARRWRSDSLTWFTYWMESIPGRENGLTYHGRALSNWWTFLGDWDAAMKARLGLVR